MRDPARIFTRNPEDKLTVPEAAQFYVGVQPWDKQRALKMLMRQEKPALALIFCLGGFGHLLLDSVVGDIYWLAPFSGKPYSMFTVPALYHPWWLNFILHWSFAFELALLAWAAVLMRQKAAR